MKCDYIPLLWRKFFFNIVSSRDYIFNYCNRPFNKFDRYCRECYLGHNSNDFETRMLDDELNIYKLVW